MKQIRYIGLKIVPYFIPQSPFRVEYNSTIHPNLKSGIALESAAADKILGLYKFSVRLLLKLHLSKLFYHFIKLESQQK